jgi:uncharacterized protein YndB with AHSA1/START domain
VIASIAGGALVADILHDLPINAPIDRVFEAVSTPAGLDAWWTDTSAGEPRQGCEYELGFGPAFNWRARVMRIIPPTEFELQLTRADQDWTGTRVGFRLERRNGKTWLQFAHTGWADRNEHYRVSCNCWASYLRILRRFLEHGEIVPYDVRLDA